MTGLSLQQALWFSFVWIGACTLLFFQVPRVDWDARGVAKARPAVILVGLTALALLVRLVPAVVLPRGAGYDIESFRRVADAFLSGEPVYSNPAALGRHPYLPFQLYLIGGAGKLSSLLGVPFVFVIKIMPIVADAALVGLVFCAMGQLERSLSQAFRWSLLYALSPVAILVSAYHGQFDAETVFLLALAWYLWRFSNASSLRTHLSAVILGFAILNKTWPLMFLPIVLIRLESFKQRAVYSLITFAVPVLFTAFYIIAFGQDPEPMLVRALTHRGVPGWWGASAVVDLTQRVLGIGGGLYVWLEANGRWVLFAGASLVYWLTRHQDGLRALTTLLVVFYVLTVGFGLQWALWVIPFALLDGDLKGLKWFTVGVLLNMLPFYYGYHLEPVFLDWMTFEQMRRILILSAIPVWFVTWWWMLRRFDIIGSVSQPG